MSNPSPDHSMLVDESLRQRFEASWASGTPEPLSECLPGSDTAEFLPTLEELVHIQLEFAWKAHVADGERPVSVQALLEEFPVLGDDDLLLRLLRQEYHCREQAGDVPSVDDYRESFPDLDLDLDQLATPPGETVVPKASDDTATRVTPDDQATLPLPGASVPASVTEDVTFNAAVTATSMEGDQTLASSAGLPEPDSPHDDATIAGRETPAVSIVDDNSTDTINTEPSGSQVVFEPGKQVPGYELLGELGRGGMGVVYRALDTRLKRVVALKMILSGAHAGEKDLKRFQKEAEAVAQLQHPNIVQIHDVGEDDGQPFLSLEFVEGGGLDEKIGGEPQPPDEAAALVEKLARAVHFAHERNIVHRDLKPANVMLTIEGEPKITDFGLAKRLEDDASQTASGSIMGTPSYMAPEQAGDKKGTIGPQTDVYALGAILYCLLTGRPPFQSSSVMDTVMQVLEQEPVPPGQLVEGLDRNLETITLKCLQKAPVRRYQSAEELAEELRRYQAGEPIQARPIGQGERTWRWCRRNPLGTLVLTLLLALGIGGPWMAWQQVSISRDLATHSYISDMQLARLDWNGADMEHLRALIRRHKDDDHRGFEWGFWNRASSFPAISTDPSLTSIRSLTFGADGRSLLVGGSTGGNSLMCEVKLQAAGTSGILYGLPIGGPELLYNSKRDQIITLMGAVPSLLSGERKRQFLFCEKVVSAISEGTVTGSQPRDVPSSLDEASVDGSLEGLLARGQLERSIKLKVVSRIDLKLPDDEKVLCTAVSPDGRLVCLGGTSNTVKYWETSNPEEGRTLSGHRGDVLCVAFDRSGDQLASAGNDQDVRLWNTSTGKHVRTFHGHASQVLGVCFSNDGRRIFSAGRDGSLRAWDGSSGNGLFTVIADATAILSLSMHPNGKRIATATRGGLVTIWDTSTGERILDLKGHRGSVTCVMFDPGGQWLASGGEDGSLRLWDAGIRDVTLTMNHSKAAIYDVTFSPDGKHVASCGFDGILRVANPDTGQLVSRLRSYGQPLDRVIYTPDGERVIVFDRVNRISSWETASGNSVKVKIPSGIFTIAFNTTGSRFAAPPSGVGGGIKIYDAQTGQEVLMFNRKSQGLRALEFGFMDQRVAVAGNGVALFDATTGNRLFYCDNSKGTGHQWNCVAYSPAGHELVAGTNRGNLVLWNATDGERLWSVKGHHGRISDVAFSGDGRRVASCGNDGTVRVWSTRFGQELLRLPAHSGSVYAVEFSPDGKQLASGGHDGAVKIWDSRPWTPELRQQHAIMNLVRHHVARSSTRQGLLEAIAQDPLVGESIRSQTTAAAQNIWDTRVTLNARGLLQQLLLGQGLFVDEAVQQITSNKQLSEELRQRISAIAKTAVEHHMALNNASWTVVRSTGAKPVAYQRALRQVRRALELRPDEAAFVNTLGVAQYRVGDFKGAITTLKKSMTLNSKRSNRPLISDLAFIAMSHYQLGDSELATKEVEMARSFISSVRLKAESEDAAFVVEMEALFAGKPLSTRKPD